MGLSCRHVKTRRNRLDMLQNVPNLKRVVPRVWPTSRTYNLPGGMVWGPDNLSTPLASLPTLGNSVGCASLACLVGGHFSCENLVLDVDTRSGLGPVASYTVPRVSRLDDKLGSRSHRPVPLQSTLTPSQVRVLAFDVLERVNSVSTLPRACNTSQTLPWVGTSRRDVEEPFLLWGCRADTSKHVGIAWTCCKTCPT